MDRKLQQHIIIVGAGVIGAAIAYHAAAHVRVTVVAGHALRATDASFGWVNASYFADDAHFRLRQAGIQAYAALAAEIDIPVQRQSSLCWETSGAAFDAQYEALAALGATVRIVDADTFRRLEPHVAEVPDRALLFDDEAVASSGALADALLKKAQARGARVLAGVDVSGLVTKGDKVVGVQSVVGALHADQVLIAAGTGTESLLRDVDVALPMLDRPGLMIKTRPVKPILSHVLASATQEVRQLSCGALLAPGVASHQSDDGAGLDMPIDACADQTITRLCQLVPSVPLAWDSVMLANRPMPEDGLPVVGSIGPDGLYVATMHSGITLAALMGELVTEEILQGVSNSTNDLLAPYRPQRFNP